MNTQNEVLKFVRDWFQAASPKDAAKGIDAKRVAEQMGIWQNDAAAALNSLCAEGRLRREGARPVRYFLGSEQAKAEKKKPPQVQGAAPAEGQPPPFHRIIGYNGSLSLQTQLAKAGASYPPNGMHMLIIGESGVGKTLMAEEIWRYMSQNRGAGEPEKPFIIFNCAEYAENPQFLLSQLFGYEKGAFTGADTAHRGLVEEANGGVLFLDEIHRLPATGQEMLFTLLDRGLYRRMGSSQDQNAQLMVIGATTENPQNALLNTFRRRIPMVIEIPPLAERPVKERIALILHFLTQETKRLNLPIQIFPHALRLLVSYQSDANIGDLKNEIQLCCARGYLAYRNEQQRSKVTPPYIEFSSSNLSRRIQGSTVPEEVERYLTAWMERNSLIISPNRALSAGTEQGGNTDLYGFIEDRLNAYRQENLDPQEIGQLVSLDMQRRFSEVSTASSARNSSGAPNIFDSVTANVMAVASELVRLASNKFNYVYPDIICNTLALYLQQIKFQAMVNQAYSTPNIHLLAKAFDGKKRFVQSVTPMLNKALDISLTDDEATIIALLLETHEGLDAKKHVGLVVIGHGASTASSIADFTNQVLLTKLVRAVDVPINLSPEQALDQLCQVTAQIDEGKGVIVLTDSDNFEYYEKQLRKRSGIRCRVAPCMGTAIALELCKAIITTDDDLDTIFFSCMENFQHYTLSLFQRTNASGDTQSGPYTGRNVILACCITGTGAARRIREWLLQFPAIYMYTEIIPIGLRENVHELAERLGSRLKLIIGFTDPKISGVPFISMEKVTSQSGINRITMILKGWHSAELDAHWSQEDLPLHIRFEQIAQRLNYFAPSIDPKQAAEQADLIVRSIRNICSRELPPDLQVRIYIHAVTMFERLKTQEPMPLPEDEAGMIRQNPEFFQKITAILETACGNIGLELHPSEAYSFLLALPTDEIV